MTTSVIAVLVSVNAIWDLLSFVCISYDCEPIASYHMGIWNTFEDGVAAKSVMAWWVLTLGYMRFVCQFSPVLMPIGSASYIFEGFFALAGLCDGSLKKGTAWFILLSCFIMAILCTVEARRMDGN